MDRLLILWASHFVGDFPFQSEWMVKFKGKDYTFNDAVGRVVCVAKWYEVMAYHVATYVATMVLFARACGYHPTPQGILADAATHYLIDTLKCRGYIKPIWLDQLFHLTVRTTLWHVGWL